LIEEEDEVTFNMRKMLSAVRNDLIVTPRPELERRCKKKRSITEVLE